MSKYEEMLARGMSADEAWRACELEKATTPLNSEDIGARITKVMTEINNDLPSRLNIVSILRDAHTRLIAAAPEAPEAFISEKIVEVLREIATHAVEQFTRRTGQQFLWVDEPELPPDDTPLMSFHLDDKGNVTF